MQLYSDRAEGEPARRPNPKWQSTERLGPVALVAQRGACPDAVVELQRTVGDAAVVQLLRDEDGTEPSSPVLDVVGRGGGQPLGPSLRAGMERALGADLSSVRVHSDGAAAASAQAVQAHAYTVGDDVVFGPGQYEPGSPSGQRTLAHELTHVVQQRNGPVSGTPTGNGISLSDPSDSFERAAETNADRIMSGAATGTAAPAQGSDGSLVQREAAPEDEQEEPGQGMSVQRQEGTDEDEEPVPA